MSTFKRLSDALGISQSISNLISNTQSGIDSITEVYDALYDLNQNNITQISNLESQIIGLSYSFSSSGLSGSSGSSGLSGSSGSSGLSGSSGSSGLNGSSGTSGLSGSSGTSGLSGSSGTSGLSGSSGTSGLSGSSGTSGLNGSSGTSGLSGSSGTSGLNGSSGSNGLNGSSGTSGLSGSLNDSVIGGYLLSSNTQKPYKLTVGQVLSTSTTGTINGESIYGHKFYCQPGSVINEIAFRIMTAGAGGLGLAACRILIYRSKLNAAGNIVAGDLELDTNTNISTLSTGLKVLSGLNYTLSSNTYKDCWFMCIRNYQSGSLSLKLHTNTGTVTWYADISQSSTTYTRDMGWYFLCPYTASTPTSMPATASVSPTTNAVASYGEYIMFGYSAT